MRNRMAMTSVVPWHVPCFSICLIPWMRPNLPTVQGIHKRKYVNPVALRKAKIVSNFGLSECNRVNYMYTKHLGVWLHLHGFLPFSHCGGNCCDILFVSQSNNDCLKLDLLLKERICSYGEQILSL